MPAYVSAGWLLTEPFLSELLLKDPLGTEIAAMVADREAKVVAEELEAEKEVDGRIRRKWQNGRWSWRWWRTRK